MLRDISGIDIKDAYSLHHEFSQQCTTTDLKYMSPMLSKEGIRLMLKKRRLRTLLLEQHFLLNCLTEGQTAYDKFRHERLDTKSAQLFDTITKTQTCSKKVKVWKAPHVKKKTINFLQMVDYARLRDFNVMSLLTHEVATTSYYLTKDNDLRKSPKSELARELKKLLEQPCPTDAPDSNLKFVMVIDFIAYAQKVPTKKMNLVTYEDFFNALWRTFLALSKGCSHIDIVFDLHLRQSIKEGEESRRSKLDAIQTNSQRSSNSYSSRLIDFGHLQPTR